MLQRYREVSKYWFRLWSGDSFSGLEEALYWIKKKIFQETDFYDNMKEKKCLK